MRPRHGAAAGGPDRGRGRGRLAAECRDGCYRGRRPAPSTPGERLRQDLGRLRPPLLLLRHPTDQGRLRDGGGRRDPPVGARGPWRPARASWCSSARTRRAGRSPDGAGRAACSESWRRSILPRTRLRLLYLQPDGIDNELLEAMAAFAVPYVDVPLQHASGAVLRRMRRSGDGAAHLALLDRVRAVLPGAASAPRSSPGSLVRPRRDFEELVAFVRSADLAVAGVFVYDGRKGPKRPACPRAVPRGLALERAARLGEVIDRETRALLVRPRRGGGRRPGGARNVPPRWRRLRAHRAAGAGRRRP